MGTAKKDVVGTAKKDVVVTKEDQKKSTLEQLAKLNKLIQEQEESIKEQEKLVQHFVTGLEYSRRVLYQMQKSKHDLFKNAVNSECRISNCQNLAGFRTFRNLGTGQETEYPDEFCSSCRKKFNAHDDFGDYE